MRKATTQWGRSEAGSPKGVPKVLLIPFLHWTLQKRGQELKTQKWESFTHPHLYFLPLNALLNNSLTLSLVLMILETALIWWNTRMPSTVMEVCWVGEDKIQHKTQYLATILSHDCLLESQFKHIKSRGAKWLTSFSGSLACFLEWAEFCTFHQWICQNSQKSQKTGPLSNPPKDNTIYLKSIQSAQKPSKYTVIIVTSAHKKMTRTALRSS